ncbi:OmpA family protein [Aquabacterium sp.]|uniref:OmpA family protein n=1 Tax=Aquabacterium sp. TaxID=1872578 RepID=UPI00199A1010|nr:OmpA family protein [Aquabacterium sp.]MBC7700112.1 OmpA family protein [Aquabacterium sp.]
MKTINALRLSAIGLGAVMGTASFAQDGTANVSSFASSYYYGGLSIGQSRAKIDEQRISASLLAGGLTTSAMSRDERDMGYKLFGGYQFNRNWAVEAGFFGLGQFGFTSTTVPSGTLNGELKLQGLNLDLVGTLPLSERLSVIGRVGAQGARARATFSGTGAVGVVDAHPRKNAVNYKFGAGLQYEINPSFFVRGEAERYRINDAVGNRGDVDLFSVSLVFPFGRVATAAPRTMAAAPAYVEPAPAPVVAAASAAVAPPVLVVPPRRKVSFSADSLFAFDASDVRPEGKVELDKLAKELSGTQFDVITVEGHTDRLGSPAYNQRLSVRRAEAVKAYLVVSDGIDANKISATGKGESTPVTRPDDCKGSKAHAKLIACLQADRRVDVEVTGRR